MGWTTPAPRADRRLLARARLPAKQGKVRGRRESRPPPAVWGENPASPWPAEGRRPGRSGACVQTGGRRNRAAGVESQRSRPGWESPAHAAALTCQTLVPRPQARAPPGRLPSPGTRPRPPPELRAPRVTGGTEAGNAATGPERREAYIGGAGRATPRSTFLSGSRLRSPGTASRQPRSAAPGPSPEASPEVAAGFPAATLRPLSTGPSPSWWRREVDSAHARWERLARVPLLRNEGLDCAAAAVYALPLRYFVRLF